jgi:hypothetical protein
MDVSGPAAAPPSVIRLPLLKSVIVRHLLALASVLVTVASCTEAPTAPVGAPYLAVVVLVDAPDAVTVRGPYGFRVRELSGTIGYDSAFQATPRDTVILSVQPATYLVEMAGVPESCGVREGAAQLIAVLPNTNTSLARFIITCRNALTIVALTDGSQPDSGYVYTVTGAGGTTRAGALTANDTLLLDNLPPDDYVIALRHVQSNCQVMSNGGDNVSVTISERGGATAFFRIACSEPARRPRIVSLAGSYFEGSAGFVVRVADIDRDVERYGLDITDCQRHSILPGWERRRGGFSGFPGIADRDTSLIVGAFDLTVPEAQLVGRCMLLWIGDERGNVSEIRQIPLVKRRTERTSSAQIFNATYLGTTGLRVALSVVDPQDDYVGALVVYNTRDGIVSLPADGQPDRLIFYPAGIIGTAVPDIPFGIGYGQWSDYLSVTVYLVDAEGNVRRLDDGELFQ